MQPDLLSAFDLTIDREANRERVADEDGTPWSVYRITVDGIESSNYVSRYGWQFNRPMFSIHEDSPVDNSIEELYDEWAEGSHAFSSSDYSLRYTLDLEAAAPGQHFWQDLEWDPTITF